MVELLKLPPLATKKSEPTDFDGLNIWPNRIYRHVALM